MVSQHTVLKLTCGVHSDVEDGVARLWLFDRVLQIFFAINLDPWWPTCDEDLDFCIAATDTHTAGWL